MKNKKKLNFSILHKKIIDDRTLIKSYKIISFSIILFTFIIFIFYLYLLWLQPTLPPNLPNLTENNPYTQLSKKYQSLELNKKAFDAYIISNNLEEHSLTVFVPLFHANLKLYYDEDTNIQQINFENSIFDKNKILFIPKVLATNDLYNNLKENQHILINNYKDRDNGTLITELYILDYPEMGLPKLKK